MADIERGVNINKIFPEVKKAAEQISLPQGVSLTFGGAYENDEEHLPGILYGLIISIFMIFMILVLHFRKISMALLVLGSSVLSLPGAFLGVLLVNVEFGITSILGIVSLIGILVRNGIIMLDYAEELRTKKNLSVKDAAMEAGKRRMRPIFLTSAAASVGVIAMIVSANPLWSPMGAVICFGTITSMILLVLILPVSYWRLYSGEDTRTASNKVKAKSVKPLALFFIGIILFGGSLSVPAQEALSLDQCRKLAMKNNTTIKNAILEIKAAEQVKKSAFTNYFPQISATAMTFGFNKPLLDLSIEGGQLPVFATDGVTPPVQVPGQFAYFPGLSLSMLDKGTIGAVTAIQPVFAGGRIIAGNKLARVGINVNQGKLKLSKEQIMTKTEEQYWQIISLYEKRKTLDLTKQLLDSLYNEAEDAWKAGLINRNEVLKVALKQSEIRQNELKLSNGIQLATMAFCQFLGLPSDSALVLADSLTSLRTPGEVYINSEEALLNRQEYKLLQESIKAEALKTRLKRGEYLPQAGIGVGGLYYDIPNDGTTNTMVFGTVNVPISDWWDAAHTLKERKLREEINRNACEEKTELMALQMQQAWNELNEAWEQITLARETLRQAQENLAINRDNYQAGLINISAMLEAQALLQQSLNQVTDACYNYSIRLNTYLQVTGRGGSN